MSTTRTPEHLTKKFGIAPEAGRGRALPRVWMAYSGPNKSAWLSVMYSMIMTAALPEEGQKSWNKPVPQAELAGRCGLASRSTFTRRLSQFANPVGERPRNPNSPCLIHRFRRVAAPNRYYAGELPTSHKNQAEPGKYHAPAADELASHPRTGHLWEAASLPASVRGFKSIPLWIWDERLPLTDTARLVFVYYAFCGLLETGEVHPRQATVASMLGISVRSVYSANCALAALGLIRVAHPQPRKNADGQLVRGPARIVYLPMRTLTHEEADQERERLLEAQKRRQSLSYWNQVQAAHNTLLDQWAGREHSMTAFWRSLRRTLLLEGVPRHVVDELIPRPPS